MKISITVEQKQTLYELEVIKIDTDDYSELENKTLEELTSCGEVLDFLNMKNKGGESMRDEYELYDYKLLMGDGDGYIDDRDMGDIIVIDISNE